MTRWIYILLALASVATVHAADLTELNAPIGAPGSVVPGVVHSAGPFSISLVSAEQSETSCPPAGDSVVADGPFGHVRQALQPGDRLDVLAVGSATVLGPDGNQPESGFPYRMAQALKLSAPQAEVTVTLLGGKGLTVEQMRDALSAALALHKYQLVLWQTGTVEAVRGLPPDGLYNTIAEEAKLLRDETDLILVDSQFSRFLGANSNIAPYQNALERVSAMPGVTLFHRFELMRNWADRGTIDLERAAPSERKATNMHLHACLGRALARMVLAGAGLHAAK
jgi:hypothetical protein